ncbi:MAG: tetratricopeptide repeat protein, partial [Deltaproteobacteria bacterium]|nr:tetratricopeptide repeat protein [Deltaproteobacteria bacterium]
HMLDCELYDLNPRGHHWSSLLIHLANGLLLFFLLKRMTGAFWKSGFVAAFFLVHPLHVESVAWVSERKDVLSTFFGMLALSAYAGYAERPAGDRYLLVVLLWSLSLMAKPMLVSLPLLLLVVDYWPLRRLRRSPTPLFGASPPRGRPEASLPALLLEKIPMVALSLLVVLLTLAAERHLGALPSLESYPPTVRISNALISSIQYGLKMFWPGDLSPIYLHPGAPPAWQVMAAAVVHAAIALSALWTARTRPFLLAGWLWYLITLGPVLGLVQIGSHSMADRYTYIPLIGLFLMIAWGLPEALSLWKHGTKVLALFGAIAVMALVPAARTQVLYWRTSVTLFQHAVEATKDNFLAHHHLGFVLALEGKTREALQHYEEALRINPDYPNARYGLATVLERMGKTEEAILHYSRLVETHPHFSRPHYNLGNIYFRQGRIEEALFHYKQALRIDPRDPMAHNNLGLALERKGRIEEALRHFADALRIRPGDPKVQQNLERLKRELEKRGAPR